MTFFYFIGNRVILNLDTILDILKYVSQKIKKQKKMWRNQESNPGPPKPKPGVVTTEPRTLRQSSDII